MNARTITSPSTTLPASRSGHHGARAATAAAAARHAKVEKTYQRLRPLSSEANRRVWATSSFPSMTIFDSQVSNTRAHRKAENDARLGLLPMPLRRRLRILALALGASLGGCADVPAPVPPSRGAPIAVFTLREQLGHLWEDELVHFDVQPPAGAGDLTLVDAAGASLPFQIEGGRLWTVTSLPPGGEARLTLQRGGASTGAAPGVTVTREDGAIVLANDRMAIALPALPGRLPGPRDVTTLPPPLRAVRLPGGAWLSTAAWVNEGPPLPVAEATTAVLEQGPVRATVKQRIAFADGHAYEAVISLAARQDAALVAETSDESAPRAAIRISMRPGPGANHVFWQNQWKATPDASSFGLADTRVGAGEDRVVCKLRPWSFWWFGGVTEWAGFYAEGGAALAGVIGLRPSRWSPDGWDGFDHTEAPITARGGGLDLTLALAEEKVLRSGLTQQQPLHREWAFVAGLAADHVTKDAARAKLRRDLVRYSEFPLDEVRGYGLDEAPPAAARPHPSLILRPGDVERAREDARRVPEVRDRVRRAIAYLGNCGDLDRTLAEKGSPGLYRRYVDCYMVERLPEALLGSPDPRFGRYLAAAVVGMARHVVELFLDAPAKPALGAFGPWPSEDVTQLALAYDLVAGLLSPEDDATARRALVFGAHVLAHPDYWNVPRGMCGSNPNMTSSIVLPRGLLGALLAGHPEAAGWVAGAETELERELREWISPGGAWVEAPGYQAASLDGLLLLATAIRNATGRDVLADPRLRATMDYDGSLLAPPDPRFSPKDGGPNAMAPPSIGNTFSAQVTPFAGIMAAATAKTDPAFSARQQFFWKQQGMPWASAGRIKGLVPGLTDPALPAAPPAETIRGFPGFGSVMRSSWTDPRQSYVAHRTGPIFDHYRADQGSFVYYAKGAPLCPDWGSAYERSATYDRSMVSFDLAGSKLHWGSHGELLGALGLPGRLAWSHGEMRGGAGQTSERHLLLVMDDDPLGANYLVTRDTTAASAPDQRFYWNLWCLARAPEISGAVVHFPGQLGVDLDVHLLSPAAPEITTDHGAWKFYIPSWGDRTEEQYGVHVAKTGARDDFFTVLFPRAAGQAAARVEALADGAGARVVHMNGADLLLLSPGKAAEARALGARVEGEIAFVRRERRGALHLAVLSGARAAAEADGWGLASAGPTSLDVGGGERGATGESSGPAHTAAITLPGGHGEVVVRVDGAVVEPAREGRTITLALPGGAHRFSIEERR